METYTYPLLISITAFFVLCIIIKPSSKFSGLLCIFSSTIIFTIASEFSRSSDNNSIEILSISFYVLLIIFILLVFLQKFSNTIKTVIIIAYSIVCLIAFLNGKSSYNSDIELAARNKEAVNKTTSFIKLYDFDVVNFPLTHPIKFNTNNKKKNTIKLKFPIIIYSKQDDLIRFDIDFNQSLDRNLSTFSYNNLNTIIIIENSGDFRGMYSNQKTKATKTNIIIHFIDKKTMKEVYTITLFGSEPPASISYKRSAPEVASGSVPSNDDIIIAIKDVLLK